VSCDMTDLMTAVGLWMTGAGIFLHACYAFWNIWTMSRKPAVQDDGGGK
jgi:hypothetical protein